MISREMCDFQVVPCVVKCPSGARLPEFKPQGCRRAAVWPWVSYVTSPMSVFTPAKWGRECCAEPEIARAEPPEQRSIWSGCLAGVTVWGQRG